MIDNNEEKLKRLIAEDKPLDIEIGFGKGQFVLQKSIMYKDVNFLGFEVKKKFANEVIKKIEKEGLENIYAEGSYANVSIDEKVPEGRVRYFYVNFPDPWWKKRHFKRRILKKEYLEIFYKKLKLDGIIHIRTDVQDYVNFVRETFSEFDCFQEVEPDLAQDGIRSNREAMCLREELPIYYISYKKIK